MKVTLLFFGELSDAISKSPEVLEAPDGATVRDILRLVDQRWSQAASVLARCVVAVNQEFATPERPLAESDEVAILPPVSGG